MAEVKKQQDEAKKEPLKDEELEKVTGGHRPIRKTPQQMPRKTQPSVGSYDDDD